MKFRRKIYPDDLDEKLSKAADLLGYEYTHIPMDGFPMKWYETYGLHLKDYAFDRFEPRNPVSRMFKGVALLVFFFVYLMPFGIWLTVFGQLGRAVLELLGLDRKSRMVS